MNRYPFWRFGGFRWFRWFTQLKASAFQGFRVNHPGGSGVVRGVVHHRVGPEVYLG